MCTTDNENVGLSPREGVPVFAARKEPRLQLRYQSQTRQALSVSRDPDTIFLTVNVLLCFHEAASNK